MCSIQGSIHKNSNSSPASVCWGKTKQNPEGNARKEALAWQKPENLPSSTIKLLCDLRQPLYLSGLLLKTTTKPHLVGQCCKKHGGRGCGQRKTPGKPPRDLCRAGAKVDVPHLGLIFFGLLVQKEILAIPTEVQTRCDDSGLSTYQPARLFISRQPRSEVLQPISRDVFLSFRKYLWEHGLKGKANEQPRRETSCWQWAVSQASPATTKTHTPMTKAKFSPSRGTCPSFCLTDISHCVLLVTTLCLLCWLSNQFLIEKKKITPLDKWDHQRCLRNSAPGDMCLSGS